LPPPNAWVQKLWIWAVACRVGRGVGRYCDPFLTYHGGRCSVLPRLAYLALCRSIRLLALFAVAMPPGIWRSSSCVTNSPEEPHDRSELSFAANDRARRTDRLGHTASSLDTQILRPAARCVVGGAAGCVRQRN
jgi:hypothetical protein